MMNAGQVLTIPIDELGFSESFRQASAIMNFKTLGDVVFILPDELINKKGFTYGWLGELSRFLDEKGMLYLLQPLPGKSCD